MAVSTPDSTVKVFFDDSKVLPLHVGKAACRENDISSDDALLTASADKNVKIWGLDFGDCHKSIFAHSDDNGCSICSSNTTFLRCEGRCSENVGRRPL